MTTEREQTIEQMARAMAIDSRNNRLRAASVYDQVIAPLLTTARREAVAQALRDVADELDANDEGWRHVLNAFTKHVPAAYAWQLRDRADRIEAGS